MSDEEEFSSSEEEKPRRSKRLQQKNRKRNREPQKKEPTKKEPTKKEPAKREEDIYLKFFLLNLPPPEKKKEEDIVVELPENGFGPFLPEEKVDKIIRFDKPFSNLSELITLGETYDPSFNYICNINMLYLHRIVEPLKELDQMIGLKDFKKSFIDQVVYLLTIDKNEAPMLHTCLYGDPGVGKTSLGRILAKIYSKCGILSSNKFEIAKREDFVAKYLGQTAVKTRKLLEEMKGGVLFLDEAYSMGSKKNDDYFAKEAIDTINAFLSENYKDFIMIIAGYEKEVEQCFFSQNQGLSRRFTYRYTIKGYSPKEMSQIFFKFVQDDGWDMVKEDNVEHFFEEHHEYFPNYGGDIRTLLDKIKVVHTRKLITLDKKDWKKITFADIEEGIETYLKEREILKEEVDTGYLKMFL